MIKYLALFIVFFALLSCSEQSPDLVPEQKADFCSKIHRNDSVTLSSQLKPVDSLMKQKTGLYVLEEGDVSMIARAWLSEYAEKSIDIQYFIFSTDNVGLIACDYLVRAADRGVKVRILVDDIMAEAGPHELLTMDSHENIEIKIYNPGVNLGKNIAQKIGHFATHFKAANQRMHNKAFIVDGKVTITGGRNIADEYFDYDHEYNFRDRDVLLIGKVSETVEKSFNQFWNDELSVKASDIVQDTSIHAYDDSRFNRLHQYACNPENFWPQVRQKIEAIPQTFKNIQASGELLWLDSVDYVSDVPGKLNEALGVKDQAITTAALVDLIKNAKQDITIQSPYLITTQNALNLLKETVQRGVRIRILTNSLCSTDNLDAFGAYQKCRKDLLLAGVNIYEFKPNAKVRYDVMTGALQKTLNYKPIFGWHAKSMVIDGKTTVIGTFNFDPRSANYNTECLTIIRSAPLSQSVLKKMEVEFKAENSWQTTLDFNPDAEAGKIKRAKTFVHKVVPKSIL